MTAEKPIAVDRVALIAPDEHDFSTRLSVAVGRINRRIRPTHDGLSHGLISALGSVVRWGELRPGDLSRIEAVSAPTMTRVVADLESRGLITRAPDPTDGRSFFVSATEAGVDAILRARFERAERLAALVEQLPQEQQDTIFSAVEALEAAAAAGLPQSPPAR